MQWRLVSVIIENSDLEDMAGKVVVRGVVMLWILAHLNVCMRIASGNVDRMRVPPQISETTIAYFQCWRDLTLLNFLKGRKSVLA